MPDALPATQLTVPDYRLNHLIGHILPEKLELTSCPRETRGIVAKF